MDRDEVRLRRTIGLRKDDYWLDRKAVRWEKNARLIEAWNCLHKL